MVIKCKNKRLLVTLNKKTLGQIKLILFSSNFKPTVEDLREILKDNSSNDKELLSKYENNVKNIKELLKYYNSSLELYFCSNCNEYQELGNYTNGIFYYDVMNHNFVCKKCFDKIYTLPPLSNKNYSIMLEQVKKDLILIALRIRKVFNNKNN